MNSGSLNSFGVEWGIKYTPVPALLIYWNGQHNRSRVGGGNASAPPQAYSAAGQPLFEPLTGWILGAEVRIADRVTVNADWRVAYKIPYITSCIAQSASCTSQHRDATANFVDLTAQTERFADNHLQLGVVALNVFNMQPRLPAYGEHTRSAAGTLQPEPARVFGKVTVFVD